MHAIQPDQILFEDPWLIAINKPSGMFTQAAFGVPNLQVDVQHFLRDRDGLAELPFVGIIHRLDRPTSGVLVFGRTTAAVRQMNEQFRERVTDKTYLALVHGTPDSESTAVDWMRKIEDEAKAEICCNHDEGAKEAILHWRVLASNGGYSLLQVKLETGRMHQIRLQLASRGFPIVGDQIYAPDGLPTQDLTRSNLFGLHAAELRFRHPKSAKQITLTAPIPEIWKENFPTLFN